MDYVPVKRSDRLTQQVAEQITNMILSGALQAGHRLPTERELCQTFDVSRTVIREAISILRAKGLIESKGRNGTFVRQMQGDEVSNSIGMLITLKGHPATVDDLMEVRRALEIQTARLAAERANEQDLAEMQLILQRMFESIDDSESYPKVDLEFHFALARATHNVLFEILLDPLTDALLEGITQSSHLPNVKEEGYQYHRRILEKVIAHDGSGASHEMYAHLYQSQRVTSLALKEKFDKKGG
jgi:GntR family transcriptional regulator, transcriptional repressor for pyruvate dehydrogenase complex